MQKVQRRELKCSVRNGSTADRAPAGSHGDMESAISPLFEKWLKKHHGSLTFRLMKAFIGHGFGKFLFRIRRKDTPGRHHYGDRPEYTVEAEREKVGISALSRL